MSPLSGTDQVAIYFRLINTPEFSSFPFPAPFSDQKPVLMIVDPAAETTLNISGWLTPSEQKKAEGLKPENRRQLWMVTHSMLNCQLASLTGIGSIVPAITTLPGGKPVLKQPAGLHFNMADTNDLAILAFSRHPVGIDVELLKTEFNYQPVVQRYFSNTDARWISKGDARRFYLLWTRKEAILKLTGAGLTDHLSGFDASTDQWTGDAKFVFAHETLNPEIFTYSFFSGRHVFSLACYNPIEAWESPNTAFTL